MRLILCRNTRLLDSKVDRRMRRETAKIELRNRKDSAVTVFVDEKFPPWVNWRIDEATHKYEKRDASTARFTVDIPADSNARCKIHGHADVVKMAKGKGLIGCGLTCFELRV